MVIYQSKDGYKSEDLDELRNFASESSEIAQELYHNFNRLYRILDDDKFLMFQLSYPEFIEEIYEE